MEDDFDDRSLVQWKRQKVLLEKRLVKSLISRGKSPRARESTLSSAERGLDDTSVHYTRAELTPSQSPQTPSTSTSVVNDAGISSTYADEQMVVSELPLERPPLRPSPKKGGCQVVRRRKTVRGVRDGRQTSLHQFATVVQRETSNGSLKNSQQPPSPLPVANSTSSRDELVTIVDQTATRSVFSKPLQTSDRGRKVVVTGGSVVEVKGSARKRQCPFYKRVPGKPSVHDLFMGSSETGMTVDAFSYGSIPECPAYFLSHFHSDHYMGLSSRFQHPIYCTQVTANLVEHVLKVPQSLLHPLLLDEPCIVEGTEVTLIDANHCPGSVMFLFKTTSGNNYLHTGDFRFCLDIVRHPSLSSVDIHHLFLDTTYCKPQYSFPTQQEVIDFAVKKSREALSRNSDTVVVSGTYTIGKERVFLALAEALGSKICVTKQKERILRCLLWPRLESLLTTDPLSATVHVLPMKKLNIEIHLVAFVPTGWSHSNKCASLSTLQPKTVGPISIYSIPYSEHSSFPELRQFVEGLHPNRVIPTVGNKSTRDRNAMMHHLQQWRNGLSAEIHTRQTSIIDGIFSMQHH